MDFSVQLLVGLSLLMIFSLVNSIQADHHQTEKTEWGTVDGQQVYLFTLKNKNGIVAKITNYGALLTELHLPDRDGKLADIVLGFDNLQDYLSGHPYFGATVGRVANRIAKGKFRLDGKEYTFTKEYAYKDNQLIELASN